jgi:Holliday junction resolvase
MSKRANQKNHQQCIDWTIKQYTDNGWGVVSTKASDMTDLIATKDNKIHYVKVKSDFIDKETLQGAILNNIVQHAMSGKADPVIAEVTTKVVKNDAGESTVTCQKISFYNPNTNARVIIARKQGGKDAKEPKVDKK